MLSIRLKQFVLIFLIVGYSFLSACTSLPYRETKRGELYIVQVEHTPTIKTPYGVSSAAGGTLGGVGKGMGACLAVGAETGDPVGLAIGIILMPICGLVGGIHGAVTSGREKTAKKEGVSLVDWVNGDQVQQNFTQALAEYAIEQKVPHSVIDGTVSTASTSKDGQLINIWIDSLEVKRQKKGELPKDDFVCVFLNFTGSVNHASEQTQINISQSVGCNTIENWQKEGKSGLKQKINKTISDIAGYLIDKYYLIYRPTIDKDDPALKQRQIELSDSIPSFILAATNPKMINISEEEYLDIYNTGMVHPFRHLRIPEINEVKPQLAWESFPQPWDVSMSDQRMPGNVSYEIEIYSTKFKKQKFMVIPQYEIKQLVYHRDNIKQPQHKVEIELDPCTTYFWRVRAKFNMEGVPRITEWGGLYWMILKDNEFLDRYSDTASLYYVFRISPKKSECQW